MELIKNSCRICLTTDEYQKFQSFETGAEILKKIFDVYKLEINKCPVLICENCQADVDIAWNVYNRIHDATDFFDSFGMNKNDHKKPVKNGNQKPETIESQTEEKNGNQKASTAGNNIENKNVNQMSGNSYQQVESTGNLTTNKNLIKIGNQPAVLQRKKSQRIQNRMNKKSNKYQSNVYQLPPQPSTSWKNNIVFECDACLKNFDSIKKLNEHIDEHNGEYWIIIKHK